MKKILLLGSGELGKEFVIAAKRAGAYVVACDRYNDAPAMQVAHRSYVFNMLDGKRLREIVEQEHPSLIIPEVEAIATPTLVELEKEGYHVYLMKTERPGEKSPGLFFQLWKCFRKHGKKWTGKDQILTFQSKPK